MSLWVRERVRVCEKIIARTSFLIKKYAWLVSNVRERCKEDAVKICGRFDGAASWKVSKCAPIGRFRLNHSWHFRMTFPREFSRTLNPVNRLIWPSAFTRIFQLWQPHSVWQLIMQTNIQRTQSTAMLPWRLPGDKTSSTLDGINFKRLLREAHRQQVAAAPAAAASAAASVEATTIPRKRQRKLQASDRKSLRGDAETAHRSLYIRVFIHKFRVISVRKWCKYLNLIMNWIPGQDNVWQAGRQTGRQPVAPKLLW